jgi:hypothetical protein
MFEINVVDIIKVYILFYDSLEFFIWSAAFRKYLQLDLSSM